MDGIPDVQQANAVRLHRGRASLRMRSRRYGLMPPSLTRSTLQPSNSSRSCHKPTRSRKLRPDSSFTRKSMSATCASSRAPIRKAEGWWLRAVGLDRESRRVSVEPVFSGTPSLCNLSRTGPHQVHYPQTLVDLPLKLRQWRQRAPLTRPLPLSPSPPSGSQSISPSSTLVMVTIKS